MKKEIEFSIPWNDNNKEYFKKILFSKYSLSLVESEICCLIAEAGSSKSIAEKRNVSLSTVHTHRRNIRKKLLLDKEETLYHFLAALYYGRRETDYLKNT